MILVNISDDPQYGFKRKAEAALIHIGMMDYQGKTVTLTVNIRYFQNDPEETEITIIPQKVVSLIADQSTCVDKDGKVVPCGSPEAVMTQYDWYIKMMDVPVIIRDVVIARIEQADKDGIFDETPIQL